MGSHFVFKSISAYETKMAALLWSREYRCVRNIAGKLRYNFPLFIQNFSSVMIISIPGVILHNQLALTKFGRRLPVCDMR